MNGSTVRVDSTDIGTQFIGGYVVFPDDAGGHKLGDISSTDAAVSPSGTFLYLDSTHDVTNVPSYAEKTTCKIVKIQESQLRDQETFRCQVCGYYWPINELVRNTAVRNEPIVCENCLDEPNIKDPEYQDEMADAMDRVSDISRRLMDVEDFI